MTEFTTWRSLVDGAEIIAIPDSVENQHLKDDWTETQWPDSVGDADLSVSNLSFDSQAFAGTGGVAASGDGDATGPAPTIDFTGPWSVSIPFETTDEGNEISAIRSDTTGDSIRFALNGLSYTSDLSNAGIAIRDDGDDFVIIDTDQSFADGDSHHMIITCGSIAANGIDVYINDMQNPESVTTRDDGISINGTMEDLTYFAFNSTPTRPITANLSNVRWAAKVLDSDERQQYQDDLPFDITD